MSFSQIYLTRRFVLQNYRDYIAMAIIGSYAGSQYLQMISRKNDDDYVMQDIYTDDESDISFRDTTNKTDGAVKKKLAMDYCNKIKRMRAEKERAAQLDAFNILHGKNL